jgi:CRISPR system Cascade subunit CasB
MQSTKLSGIDEGFVSWLEELSTKANDESATPLERGRSRAALAAFRRGLGKPPGTAVEMLRYIPPFVFSGVQEEIVDIYLLVASLFAMHPTLGGTGSIGSTLASVRALRESDSIEARFIALLNCHEGDLHKHLRHAVALAKSSKSSVPVDWRQLLHDLKWWRQSESGRNMVRRQWARDFWGRSEVQPQNDEGGAEQPILENE